MNKTYLAYFTSAAEFKAHLSSAIMQLEECLFSADIFFLSFHFIFLFTYCSLFFPLCVHVTGFPLEIVYTIVLFKLLLVRIAENEMGHNFSVRIAQ